MPCELEFKFSFFYQKTIRYRVSVEEDEKVLGKNGGDGYTTMWMYLMPQNCT